ncbi:hypothetical protein [Burkholderia stagnalis]|uniref:hypothetical protein n=1 Tax=Burkholderia stagnalis TaxID=1503054 RepID=UPI000F5FCF8E|nr:hypothetical protein [Burkholderia stagnalis]RQY36526.1 hypothetical protein DF116_20605 [Burkholderia stagnalis]
MSKKHPAIKVASAKEGFRRAGHVFGIVPKTIALAALHPDAHAAIVADKSLVVVDTAIYLSDEEAAALPHHGADHVSAALANADALALDVSEDDAKRALALADIEAELVQREASIKLREADLKAAEDEFEAAEADLKRRVAELDERYAGLVTRENDLLARIQAFEAEQEAAKSGGKTAQASSKKS